MQKLAESPQGTEQLGVAESRVERYQGKDLEELLLREEGTATTTVYEGIVYSTLHNTTTVWKQIVRSSVAGKVMVNANA